MNLYFHNFVIRIVFLLMITFVISIFLHITLNSTLAVPKLEKQFNSIFNYYSHAASYWIERHDEDNQVQGVSYTATKAVPVLLYHGIAEKVKEDDDYSVTKQQFRDHLFELKKAGYQTITIDEYIAFVKGEKELPDKSFLLTFDDGRKDSYYEADPILHALNFNAVMYVASDSFTSDESPYYLTKAELIEMRDTKRWEIQSHGDQAPHWIVIDDEGRKGHFLSNLIWLPDEHRFETKQEFENRILSDMVNWKSHLQNELGVESKTYAFPFGDYGQDTNNFLGAKDIVLLNAESVFEVGFEQVRSGAGYSFNYQNDNTFLGKRIEMNKSISKEKLLALLHAGFAKNTTYQTSNFTNEGWIRLWGDVHTGENELIVGASKKTKGGGAFLDGTKAWKDYAFEASGKWFKGESISLLARYIDEKNHISCSFSKNYVRIEQVVNGKETMIVEEKLKTPLDELDITLGVVVYNNEIGCYINQKHIVSGSINSNSLQNGGIGIKTWDPIKDNSSFSIYKIHVQNASN